MYMQHIISIFIKYMCKDQFKNMKKLNLKKQKLVHSCWLFSQLVWPHLITQLEICTEDHPLQPSKTRNSIPRKNNMQKCIYHCNILKIVHVLQQNILSQNVLNKQLTGILPKPLNHSENISAWFSHQYLETGKDNWAISWFHSTSYYKHTHLMFMCCYITFSIFSLHLSF